MNIDQFITSASASTKRGENLDPAQKKKLEKAVREFESVFVGYMLKSMRNTIEKTDNSTDSFGGDMLEGMFDVELAKHLSKNSNLGLADMLFKKMTGGDLANTRKVASGTPTAASMPLPTKASVAPRVIEQVKAEQTVPVQLKLMTKSDTVGLSKSAEFSTVLGGKKSKSLDERLRSYDPFIAEASEKFGVSDSLIKAVIATESAARANVQSPKNAKGLMQLIDSTASDMGVKNVWDPRENILGGTKYLKHLLEKFEGDEKLAIASYNAGPGAIKKHGGIPPYRETKDYVARVTNFLKMFEQQVNNLVEENDND